MRRLPDKLASSWSDESDSIPGYQDGSAASSIPLAKEDAVDECEA